MHWLHCEKIRSMLVGMVVAIVLGGGSAEADFAFGEPVNLGPPVSSAYGDGITCVTADGLEMYISCLNRPGGLGGVGTSGCRGEKRLTTTGASRRILVHRSIPGKVIAIRAFHLTVWRCTLRRIKGREDMVIPIYG